MIMAGMCRFAATRIRHWNASIVAGLAFVASVAAAQCGLPAVDEMPPALPGALPWKFRAAAIAMQAVPWAVIGLLFGYLAARSGIPGRRDAGVGFRPAPISTTASPTAAAFLAPARAGRLPGFANASRGIDCSVGRARANRR
ncbi:ABC transporter permease [Burkholderia mallei]|nr:CbtA family protein [Burkholderia mallei]ABM48145.1 ABC transporter, permease protein [Burkholderia mallei SAVP1]AIW49171.1 ABC transporter permease [Burkholderia mallei]AOP69955.1 ABC transporter permease [Burkholderia mallei]ATE36191.1 ABC transporter permease [Burkholderia mallei]ATE41104.1 ABC transporter permease [Burkholderia mallei]